MTLVGLLVAAACGPTQVAAPLDRASAVELGRACGDEGEVYCATPDGRCGVTAMR